MHDVVIRIPTIQERAYRALGLMEQLKGQPVEIYLDAHRHGIWANVRRAWTNWTDASHILVLQDDAILAKEFKTKVMAAIDSRPDDALSFFTHGQHYAYVKTALKHGESWYGCNDAAGVALCLPKDLARTWVHFSLKTVKKYPNCGDDLRLVLWATVTGRYIWHTVPGLVQHDETAKSTHGFPGWSRVDPDFDPNRPFSPDRPDGHTHLFQAANFTKVFYEYQEPPESE